jgi:hypothetical protein
MLMSNESLRVFRAAGIWSLSFIAIGVIGRSLVIDLSGLSAADAYVVTGWAEAGLRGYLWLEGGLLIAVVIAVAVHVISNGLRMAREGSARLFGILLPGHHRVSPQIGYVFVVLGCALAALSITTLVLLNSCRYMRLI